MTATFTAAAPERVDVRIVSLLPAATEIVYALGLEPVGVTHECDYPPDASDKPAIIRSRVDSTGASQSINEQVADAAESGGVYEIDRRALREADPDLLITQGVCEVCALDSAEVTNAVQNMALDADVVTIDPHSLGAVLDAINRIGEATGVPDAAAALVRTLETRLDRLGKQVDTTASRPTVVVVDWMDPPMVAGHWVPELIDRAGGVSAITDPGDRSVPHEWTRIVDADPDVLIVAPCGFTPEQTRDNLVDLLHRDGWASLTAVETGRAFVMDGHHHVNRPGPRLIEAAEHLAGLFHHELANPPADVARPLPLIEADR